MARIAPFDLTWSFFKTPLLNCSLTRTFCKSSVVETTCGLQN